MNEIIDFLFSQYSSYSESFIFLESFAVGMNILSVIYEKQNNISRLEKKEYIQLILLALGSLIFIYFVYVQFDKWNSWTAYVDNITTAIFFVAMWLMARRKIESWIFWIIGDLITVPLYFYKGLTISSLQYIIFTVLAILGYRSWKKILLKTNHQ